jgi:hypothetical protein
MKEYSPKRRTAVVFTGTGVSGAYHAGVLRALDESGVKIDVVVGSGAGCVTAAFAAVAGGPRLYGPQGFWDEAGWASFYRLRPPLRAGVLLLAMSFGVFLLPLALAVLAGLLFPLGLLLDLVAPSAAQGLFAWVQTLPALLRTPYLAALSVPVFALSVTAVLVVSYAFVSRRRRFAEAFESPLDAAPGRARLSRLLWEVARGSAISLDAPSREELGRRYVSLLAENLGQPGFRELVLRAADLDLGAALPFVALQEPHRAAFTAARARDARMRGEGTAGAIDLTAPGYDALFFDAVVTGLLPPLATPLSRLSFPRGGPFPGETHRLTDATLAPGTGLSEALDAGAEQVILVTGVPEAAATPSRRRGLGATADALLSLQERGSMQADVATAETLTRMIETLGHRTPDGGRGWQDPANGRIWRDFALYIVRPERRSLGALELDGSQDPATEVMETPEDLAERGFLDAYRLFVEPVVGAPAPEPRRRQPVETEEGEPIEL